MGAGLRRVASGLAATLIISGTTACGPDDDRVRWGHGGRPDGGTPTVRTVGPAPIGPTGLRRVLAHVRASPATRLGFAYGAALRAPVNRRTDLTTYGYDELGDLGRHLGKPLGFSVSAATMAFTAGRGATAAGGLVGAWNPGVVRTRLTGLGATATPGGRITRYAVPRNAEFAIEGGPKASPRPVTLPPVLRYVGVSAGLIAYGGNPGALADVTEARANTLAGVSPFRELSLCLGDVRAAIITPGRAPYAAGTRVRGGRVTSVLCVLPGRGDDPAALAGRIRARAATFTVAYGDTVRPLPADTRVEVVRGRIRTVRVRVGAGQIDGDAFLRSAVDGDLTTLIGG